MSLLAPADFQPRVRREPLEDWKRYFEKHQVIPTLEDTRLKAISAEDYYAEKTEARKAEEITSEESKRGMQLKCMSVHLVDGNTEYYAPGDQMRLSEVLDRTYISQCAVYFLVPTQEEL